MGAVTLARQVMAGLLLLGGLLAVVAGFAGSGTLDGGARALWLAGVVAVLLGCGAGGYTLVPTAPLWLRAVVVVGCVGLVAVVLTALLPDLEVGTGGAVAVGVVSAVAGGLVHLATRRTAAGSTGQTT